MRARNRQVLLLVIAGGCVGAAALAGLSPALDLTGAVLVDPFGRWTSSNPTTTSVRMDENASSSSVTPGWVVTDFTLSGGASAFELTAMVEAGTGDDDLFGFVFGYQDNSNFYQVDWKKGGQTFNWGDPVTVNDDTAERGIKLKKIEGGWTRDGLWGGKDGEGVSELAGPVDRTWVAGTAYRFRVDWSPPQIVIWFDGEQIIDVMDDTFTGGRIGFFGFSQDNLVFEMLQIDGSVVAPCDGDSNGDGVINFSDITEVLMFWNIDYAPDPSGPGDANNDGVVNFGDITAVLDAWNTVCP